MRSGGWRLQKLPRGVLGAAPRACVANPTSRVCPAPFSTQSLPPPAGERLLLPTSRPPLVSFTFDFTLESSRDPRATAGRQPGRGNQRRNQTQEDAVARPAAADGAWHWLGLYPSAVCARRCQALSLVSWRFLGTGEKNRFRECCSLSCHNHTHDLSHTLTVSEPKWGVGILERLGRGAP